MMNVTFSNQLVMMRIDNPYADRHRIWVDMECDAFVSSHTGRYMSCVYVFYPYHIPNGIKNDGDIKRIDDTRAVRHKTCVKMKRIDSTCAVRHRIWVEKECKGFVSSHTGRYMSCVRVFYPYHIPNGVKIMSCVRGFYPYHIPNGIKIMSCVRGFYQYHLSNGIKNDGDIKRIDDTRAVRHKTCVKMKRIDSTRAVRHRIWVEKECKGFVSSHTGRDMSHVYVFYPYYIPNGVKIMSCVRGFYQYHISNGIKKHDDMKRIDNTRAVRHRICVEKECEGFVSSHTGRYMSHVYVFYPYHIPNGIKNDGDIKRIDDTRAVRHKTCVKMKRIDSTCAVRHRIWVENECDMVVSSHTGRDMSLLRGFYPYHIPNGIRKKINDENFKELEI